VKSPREIRPSRRAEILAEIQAILWWTGSESGNLDPDKVWTPDTIDAIARVMTDAGLGPTP
jgi:hypothetical protein